MKKHTYVLGKLYHKKLVALPFFIILLTIPQKFAYASGFTDWFDQPTMTGDWGGVRTNLDKLGIVIHGGMISEVTNVAAGGERQGTDYVQSVNVGADFDLAKLVGINGAMIHFQVSDNAGRSASNDFVGNRLQVSTVFGGGEDFRLVDLTYEQHLLDGAVITKIGYYPLGDDFGYTPLLADDSLGIIPAHPLSFINDSGFEDYPNARWGGRIKVFVAHDLYVQAGLFDINPDDGTSQNGFRLTLDKSTGAISLVEIMKTIHIGGNNLVGHYKVGGYYDTSESPNLGDTNTVEDSGRYGGYAMVDQMLYRESPNSERNLTMFAQATVADSRTALITSLLDAGIIQTGTFPGRNGDTIELAFAETNINSRKLREENLVMNEHGVMDPALEEGERDVLLAYGIEVAPWLVLRPSFQYVGDPGADLFKHIPDAFVFSLATKIRF